MPLPTVSLAALRDRDASALAALRASLSGVGFLHLVDHEAEEVLAALAAARAFFTLPDEAKARATHARKGFIPVNGCVNAVRPPHLHEKFSCGRLAESLVDGDPYYAGPSEEARLYFGDPNKWPDEKDAPGFRASYETAYRAFERLCVELHSAIAAALGLADDFFTPALSRHVTNLCALHYPGRPDGLHQAEAGQSAATRAGELLDDALRVKPHTDPTSLTVLAHEAGDASGLQVLDDEAGWIDVGAQPDALTVNVGDILHFWTNGEFKSARHRVVGDSWRSRLSLVFFCMPGYDALIEAPDTLLNGQPPRYPSFACGQRSHFAQSLRDAQGLPDRQLLSEQSRQ